MVISFLGSGAGMTGFSGSICKTGFFSSVLFSAGLRMVFTTAISSAVGFPLPGFNAVFVNFVISDRRCPADLFWHLARQG